jgi:hypothetical protein
MPGAKVRYDDTADDGEEFIVEGFGRFGYLRNMDGIGGPADVLGPASLSQLLAAASRAYRGYEPPPIHIFRVDPSIFDDKHSPPSPLSIEWQEGQYLGVLEAWLASIDFDDVFENEDEVAARLRSEVEPWLRRHRCRFVSIEFGTEGSGFAGIELLTRFIFAPPSRCTVAELIEISDGLEAVVKTIDTGGLNFERALDLLVSGQTGPFLGQPENEWLEVKAFPYPLDTEAGKIELAQDIARFANGDNPALLVIGFRTIRREGTDLITKATSAPSEQLSPARYRAVLNSRLYPHARNLAIHAIPVAIGRSILVIMVPRQPDTLKPFLVHGAIVGNRVEGAFISVVRRSGEASVPISIPELHALLVAGRQALGG